MQHPFAKTATAVIAALHSSPHGLSQSEAKTRLEKYGANTLPRAEPPGLVQVFFHQFTNPLIYILIGAAILSISVQKWSDAIFITVVLLLNAIIGTIQEFSAQRAAIALQKLVNTHCRVVRDGETYEINTVALVPGDIILFESGDRIPADVRLISSHDLEIDESLLTGESVTVLKDASLLFPTETYLGDRKNMVFAGTLVNRGRARGVVVATAMHSELGHIAADVIGKEPVKAPLLVRMERFTHRVAIAMSVATILLATIGLLRGIELTEMLMLAVALAVAAIPEGLPVALTVALAIGMRRMATRHVIIRRLIAVEALGSCTFIATDKTGTLTVNQLTAQRIMLPDSDIWEISGKSMQPEGMITSMRGTLTDEEQRLLQRICKTAILPNDAFIGHRDGGWTHHGDAVDVALLVMAHKAGFTKVECATACPELATIPFESERLYAASLNQTGMHALIHVKGALERLVPMCNTMATSHGDVPINAQHLLDKAQELASQGYRVLALASGQQQTGQQGLSEDQLHDLTLLCLIGMIDPLRKESRDAVAACHDAGIAVAMITGDHPATALAIASELNLANDVSQIVTGPQLRKATNDAEYDQLTANARVFARVEPRQKLMIVQSLQRQGHFVAVSGDGANDAPALNAAHIGVAMGKSGTDVARETASMIITDDNFASIVSGIEEGRIAYANVRKVTFLLISTGASEIVLFTLALLSGLPIPLLAVQLLWLNLVTNGIQDVALAFEPAEGGELKRRPRSPKEPMFNRLMIERVVISATVIGTVAFGVFYWLLQQGYNIEEARNGTMLLMVLFENIHVFNSRSETRSAFFHNPLRNPLLLIGTAAAQLIHIGAMYTPWISDVLHIQPVSFELWAELLMIAATVLIASEIHKWLKHKG